MRSIGLARNGVLLVALLGGLAAYRNGLNKGVSPTEGSEGMAASVAFERGERTLVEVELVPMATSDVRVPVEQEGEREPSEPKESKRPPQPPEAGTGVRALAPAQVAATVPDLPLAAPAESDFATQHRFDESVSADNVMVWPIYTNGPPPGGIDRVTSLFRAQREGTIEIRELEAGDAYLFRPQSTEIAEKQEDAPRRVRGSVVIVNRADEPVLVPGGTIIKGGKQDRLIPFHLVVAGDATATSSAFCVEAGRSNPMREGRHTGGIFTAVKPLASMRVRDGAQRERQQQRVWEEVARQNRIFGRSPATSTYLASIEDEDPHWNRERTDLKDRLQRELEWHVAQEPMVGFAYAIEDKPVAVWTFASNEVFAELWDQLLETMSMEAITAQRGRLETASPTAPAESARAEDFHKLISRIDSAEEQTTLLHGDAKLTLHKNDHGSHVTCWMRRTTGDEEWIPLVREWTAAVEAR